MNEHEQRKQALYRAIRARGLSHAHAMGMMANAMGESGFNPAAHNPNEDAFGLFQWRGSRLEELRRKYGPNPNIEAQVEFALSEPEGREYAETRFDSPVAATDYFIRKFERPADPDAALSKRASWVQGNVDKFGTTPPPSVPPTWPPPGIDPTSPARVPVGQGFQPTFQSGLDAMIAAAREAGHDVSISSGYRTPARQKMLFDQAVAKYGSPEAARKHVAPPGSSAHNHGFAADLAYGDDAARQWVHENAGRFGLGFRMGHEPWHIEPAGYHPRYGTEWAPDTRMASLNGGGMAVSPYDLPDRWSQLPQIPQLPEEQAMQNLAQHPLLAELIALQEERNKPDPWAMLGAMGMGILNAGGGPGAGNWFGKGVAAAAQSMQENSPEKLSLLQMLQANNELYELDAQRAEKERAKQERAMQRQYLQSIADNESLPMPTRFQAQTQLLGLPAGAVTLPEPKTYGTVDSGIWREGPNGQPEQWLAPQGEKDVKTIGTPQTGVWEVRGTGADTEYELVIPAQGKEPQMIDGLDGNKYWVAPNQPPKLVEGIGEPNAIGLDPNQAYQLSQSAAGQWEQSAAKIFEEPVRRFGDIASKDPRKMTGAEQRTVIVNYAKMLDPTAAVMENEADAVRKAGEKMPLFNDWWRKIVSGKMKPETMANIMLEAEQLAVRRYRELASTYGSFMQRLKLYGQEDPIPWIGEMMEAPKPVRYMVDEKGNVRQRGERVE